jgi:hypothetical protein
MNGSWVCCLDEAADDSSRRSLCDPGLDQSNGSILELRGVKDGEQVVVESDDGVYDYDDDYDYDYGRREEFREIGFPGGSFPG